MSEEYSDITKTGPVGLEGLKGLNQQSAQSVEEYIASLPKTRQEVLATYSPQVGNVGLQMGTEYGKSVYDKYADELEDVNRLNDVRGYHQSAFAQVGAGALKMLGTAGTTFLDNTLGLIYGVGTGIQNITSSDEERRKLGFWRGVWDNDFTNAMADFQEKMEEWLPNYQTDWEQNASVFQKMFSGAGAANFWGNSVLKNAGFTLGAAASMYATAGLGAVTGVTSALQNAGRAGKLVNWLARTFVASAGEASIEALNATRDNEKLMDQNIAIRINETQRALETQYQNELANGIDPIIARNNYQSRLAQLEEGIEKYRQQMKDETTDAGNAIFAGNLAVLSVSNNLQLSSLIRGGYTNAANLLDKVVLSSEGKILSDQAAITKALMDGSLKFSSKEIKNQSAKIAGRWALGTAQEGFEEGAQGMLSTTGQIRTQAKMNKYAKDNTMLGTMVNQDAAEELTDLSKAFYQAYSEQFGQANSPGWEEVMAGLITGAIGIGGIHRNEQGKIRPTWHGGIKEAIEDVTGEKKQVDKYANYLNKALESQQLHKNAQHAVEQLVIKSKQDEFLSEGNILSYKNLEIQQVVSNALFASETGLLDSYLAIYDQMSNEVSDEDVKQLRLLAKDDKTGVSALDGMTDDEIKNLYQEKAKSTKAKIQDTVDIYRETLSKEGKKYSTDIREFAMKELTFLNTLLNDTIRRQKEIEEEKQSLQDDPGQEKRYLTPLEKDKINRLGAAFDELEEQRKELTSQIADYQAHPEKLTKEINESLSRYKKQELYKEAERAIENYKKATTLKDVVDIYTNSPIEEREKVLNQAITQADARTKQLLESFKEYTSNVSAMEDFIKKEFAPKQSDNAEKLEKKTYMQSIFQNMLNTIVNDMLEDDTTVLSRKSLQDHLAKHKEDLLKYMANYAEDASYIKRNPDGSLVYTKPVDDMYLESYLGENGKKQQRINPEYEQRLMDAFAMSEFLQEMSDTIDRLSESLTQINQVRNSGQGAKRAATFKELSFDEPATPTTKTKRKPARKTETAEETGLPKLNDRLSKILDTKKVVSDKTGITYVVAVPKPEYEGKTPPLAIQGFTDAQIAIDKQITKAKENLKNTTDQATIKRIISDLLDIAHKHVLGTKRKNALDSLLEEYKDYLPKEEQHKQKPTKKPTKRPEHINEEGQLTEDSSDSLRGNNYTGYDRKKLNTSKQAVPVTFKQSTLAEYGMRMQQFIDTTLHRIIEKKPDIAVHYVMQKGEENTVVFLAFKASDVPSGIDTSTAVRIQATDEQGEVGDYILWGNLGYYSVEGEETGDAAIQKASFGNIYEYLNNARKDTTSEYFVSTKYTNQVKDQTSGATVRIGVDDKGQSVRDLQELLAGERNPFGLTIDNLSWVVVEGKEGEPTFKQIGDINDAYGLSNNAKPGQLYLYIPSSTGVMIPVYMEAVFYNELSAEEEETPLRNAIRQRVERLADSKNTEEDKRLAIAELNDYLVFSHNHVLHYNDSTDSLAPNTIKMTNGGFTSTVVDLNSESTIEENTENIFKALQELNPRINIYVQILKNNPSFYLNSGVLKTDCALLGTVNSQVFVYPVQLNGEPIAVINKQLKREDVTYTQPKTKEYLDGKYFYFDGTDFYNDKGEILTGKEREQAQVLYDIKEGKFAPIVYNKEEYYDVNGTMYAGNGHGGLNTIDDETRKKVLKAGSIQKTKNARKKALKKKVQSLDEDPTANELPTESKQEESKENKQKTKRTGRNFVNSDDISDLISQKDLQNSEKSSNFAAKLTTLLRGLSPASRKNIYDGMASVGVKTAKQFAELLAQEEIEVSDSQVLTEDKIAELIKNLKDCHNK